MAAAKDKTKDETTEAPKEEAKVPATQKEHHPVPAEYEAYAEDAGMGYDNQTADDISIPFIDILQSGSPECKGEDPAGKPGQIINRSSGEIYPGKDGGAAFVPVYTEHVMTEWVPLDKGGGLVATYSMDDPLVRKVRSEQPLGKYKHRDVEHQPALVLLDLKLPKVDGFEVMRQIRSDPVTRLIPVVLLTSSREQGDLLDGYGTGANGYVVKPVDFDEFVRAVQELGDYWIRRNEAPPETLG